MMFEKESFLFKTANWTAHSQRRTQQPGKGAKRPAKLRRKPELSTARDCINQTRLGNRKTSWTLPPFLKVPKHHGWFKQTELAPKLVSSNLVWKKNCNKMASARIRSVEKSSRSLGIVTRASSRSVRLLGLAPSIHESQKEIPGHSVVRQQVLRVRGPKPRHKEPEAVPSKKASHAYSTPKWARGISSQASSLTSRQQSILRVNSGERALSSGGLCPRTDQSLTTTRHSPGRNRAKTMQQFLLVQDCRTQTHFQFG